MQEGTWKGDKRRRPKRLDSQFPIQTMSTQHAPLVPTPTEHGKWNRNRHVDPNLSRLNRTFKHPGRSTRVCKDGRTVSVIVSVDEFDGGFERVDVDDGEDGSEDFNAGYVGVKGDHEVSALFMSSPAAQDRSDPDSRMTIHPLLRLQNRRSYPIPIRVTRDFDPTSIQEDLSALFLT